MGERDFSVKETESYVFVECPLSMDFGRVRDVLTALGFEPDTLMLSTGTGLGGGRFRYEYVKRAY